MQVTSSYTTHEVASVLASAGYEATLISSVLTTTCSAAPKEAASALLDAGYASEIAIAAAFGECVGAMGKEFSQIGGTVVSRLNLGVDATGGFFVNDVPGVFTKGTGAVVNGVTGTVEAAANAIGHLFG
jgi:hypothetical protein